MSYRRNLLRGTTSWAPRGGRKHTLSGTVFGDDEPAPVEMSPVDVSDPAKDEKIKAGCTPLEIVASPGTTPYNHCQQLVEGARAAGGGGWGAALSSMFSTAAKPKSSSASSSSLLTSLVGSLFAPTRPVYAPPPQTGMSTGTKLALVGGGAVLLIALMRRD